MRKKKIQFELPEWYTNREIKDYLRDAFGGIDSCEFKPRRGMKIKIKLPTKPAA